MIKVQSFFILYLTLLAFTLVQLSSADDDDSSSSSSTVPTSPKSSLSSILKRTPKTSKPSTSSVSMATHPPWPTRSTESYGSVSRATHPPWPTRGSTTYDPYADFYSSRATHAPYPPVKRATHPPFPPLKKGSSGESSSSSSSSSSLASSIVKKQLLKIDADSLRNWLKEAFAYIAAPLFVPSAITKAIKAPPGLASPSRSLWSKMIASFRSVILKKNDSEENGSGSTSSNSNEDRTDQSKENVVTFYRKLAEKMASSSWATILSGKKAHKRNVRSIHRRSFRAI